MWATVYLSILPNTQTEGQLQKPSGLLLLTITCTMYYVVPCTMCMLLGRSLEFEFHFFSNIRGDELVDYPGRARHSWNPSQEEVSIPWTLGSNKRNGCINQFWNTVNISYLFYLDTI